MDAICNMELKMKHSSTFGRGLLQVGDTENNSGLSFSLALLIYGFGIPFTLPVAALPLYGDVWSVTKAPYFAILPFAIIIVEICLISKL